MAIIYTYPVKTIPSLQDSIVITDEADNKKTKITGIGAIIALITGDFCTTSISQISPPVGDIVTAIACETGISFTSSDASVTITGNNVSKKIDFKTVGSGGGCPPTYVMRRVSCEEGECFISEKYENWLYTCDETLGALAPGYINNITLNGVVDPECWYIELATFSASATTCEICCPPSETVYKLSPCDGSINFYYTTETLTPGIAALVGMVSLITTPAGELCYTVSEESGDIPIAVVLGLVQDDCASPACDPPEVDLRWKMCSEDPSAWRYEDELDPIPAPFNTPGNHYIGEMDTLGICVNGDCCIEVEETISLGLAVAWSTFIAATSCDSAYNATWEDCACCENYDVVEYTACDEGCGPPTPIYINICEMGNHFGELWKPDVGSGRPTFILIAGCCYELTNETPCVNETLISVLGFTYEDTEYGSPTWEDCTCEEIVNFQYRPCGDPTWIDTDTDLDAYHNGNVWGDSALGTCYEINSGGPGGPPIDPATLFPDEYSSGPGSLTACDCCEQDLREYIICDTGINCDPGASFQIFIDVSSIVGYDPITYATIIAQDGATIQCCYNYVGVAECQDPTGTFISIVTGCEDESCDLLSDLIELTSCTDPFDVETVDPVDLIPDPSALTDVDVINVTSGPLSSIASCWRITQLNAPGPVTIANPNDWNGPIAPGLVLSECECCEQDLRQYNICEGAAGVTCDALAIPILLIDVALVPGWGPVTHQFVAAQEIVTGIDCCYELDTEGMPDCEEPTGTISNTVADCEDILCNWI